MKNNKGKSTQKEVFFSMFKKRVLWSTSNCYGDFADLVFDSTTPFILCYVFENVCLNRYLGGVIIKEAVGFSMRRVLGRKLLPPSHATSKFLGPS